MSATAIAASTAKSGRTASGCSFRPIVAPLGYVFQEASLFPHLSVKANLRFGAPPPGVTTAIGWDEVVDLCGLAALLERAPRALSGGERQRVALGRALLSQPRLLLMDEPLSALDEAAKAEILPFLERLRDRLALPALYVTHDMTEVERLADHLALIDRGRIVAAGPLAQMQSDATLPLAAARAAAVTLEGKVVAVDNAYGLTTIAVNGGAFVAPGALGPVGAMRRLRVLAADVSLAVAPPGPSSILNVLPARVLALRAIGGRRAGGRSRAWRGRRRRPHPRALDPPVVGAPRPRRRRERASPGQRRRAVARVKLQS